MKMKIKRTMSLLLAFALTGTLTACGDGTDSPQAASDTASTSAASGDQGAGSEASAQTSEAVTLRIYLPSSGAVVPLTAGIQDDPIANKILEDVGVVLEVELQNEDKTQAMVASGDMLDLNVINKVDYIEPLIKVSAIASFEDYLEFAPEITANFSGLVDFSRDEMSAGTGQLYVLPARAKKDATPVSPGQDGNYIRWDYYEEIGTPEIGSIDDLVGVLEQIVANHPTTDDGKQIYGTATFIDVKLSGFRNAITKKYHGNSIIGPLDSYSLVDLSYRDLYNDYNDIWLATTFYNKMNQKGLLDPESFSQKRENVIQKITEGRIMHMQAEWYMTSVNQELTASTDGAAKFVDIPFADTEEFPAWYDRSAPFGYVQRMFVMGSNTEHPEKVMELLNWVYSVEGSRTINNGVKGETWDFVDGRATILPESLEARISDPNYMVKTGMEKYTGMVGHDYDAMDETGTYINLMNEKEIVKLSMTAADQAYCAHYGAEVPLDVIGNRQYKSTANLAYEGLMPTDIPTDISRTVTQIENYLMQELPLLIQQPDDASYAAKREEIRGELQKLEYDKVRDFYKEAFETAVTKYEDYK